jgi:hypothetical protein
VDGINELTTGADHVVAVLGRTVIVRLVNISSSGCLLECDSAVAAGTTGCLTVFFEGRKYVEDIRITRCREHHGSSGHRLGAEFLWLTRPPPDSLRRLIARLRPGAAKNGRIGGTHT